ncbi:hypothetical protein D3C79_539320 [compost metagenome]
MRRDGLRSSPNNASDILPATKQKANPHLGQNDPPASNPPNHKIHFLPVTQLVVLRYQCHPPHHPPHCHR